jgi:nitrile hydratase subunit alpha
VGSGQNETMGRIIARAWSNLAFKDQLLANPETALAELDWKLPTGKSVVAVENTSTLTHIVLTAPRFTETKSVYSDIKDFGESYRDPRLFSLNWGSHDPVFTARFKADPKTALRYLGVDVPDKMTIEVLENSTSQIYLVLPPCPKKTELSKDVIKLLTEGQIPAALRYANIFGPASFQQFF